MGVPGPVIPEAGLLRFITAGSVDDGKSTLIGRLLHDTRAIFSDQLVALRAASQRRGLDTIDFSLLTDGLEAEREQGITIDVAYRYFATPRRKFIIGDAPGHVQYTRNMVTAASTADVAVLLIDARKGVVAQTRRHAYIARWLGVSHLVLVVNKMDLVGYSQSAFEAHRDAFLRFAATLPGFEDVAVIPASALAGDMVAERGDRLPWYAGPTLLEYLERVPALRERVKGGFRLPVQRVARPGQLPAAAPFARGYQGTIAAGSVRVGDEVMVLPLGEPTTVTAIESADVPRIRAHADEAVTVFLADELDIGRGDMLAALHRPAHVRRDMSAEVCWLSSEPYEPQRALLLKHTTRTIRVANMVLHQRIDVETLDETPDPPVLRMNDIAGVHIRLQRPACVDAYTTNRTTGSFILIDPVSNETVGAGVIRDPAPQGG